ncbi:MAG: hypothetical protein HC882_05485 [Acidobacteria bacterium]|nr:hypothetical protein [Acidobacteriota bacterium]
MTRDIQGTGTVIKVRANDVDLDLGGHRITTDAGGVAISVISAENVRVRNGSVKGGDETIEVGSSEAVVLEDLDVTGGATEGIRVYSTSCLRIQRVQALGSTGTQIDIDGNFDGSALVLRDVEIGQESSGTSFVVRDAVGARIEDVSVLTSGASAMNLDTSEGSVVRRVRVLGDTGYGLVIESSPGTWADRIVASVTTAGFEFETAQDERLTDASIVGSSTNVSISSDRAEIRGVLANGAGYAGIWLQTASASCVVRENVARGNASFDFLDNGTGNDSAGDNFLPTLR